jgi:hypothetical protein
VNDWQVVDVENGGLVGGREDAVVGFAGQNFALVLDLWREEKCAGNKKTPLSNGKDVIDNVVKFSLAFLKKSSKCKRFYLFTVLVIVVFHLKSTNNEEQLLFS